MVVESSDKVRGETWPKRIPVMTVYSPDELESFFANAGLWHIEARSRKDWFLKGMKSTTFRTSLKAWT